MKKAITRACTIEAPCKINLHLKIGKKRPDGFHDLESLFAALAFGDTIHFKEAGSKGALSLITEWETTENAIRSPIPVEENLVFRAVSLFRKQTGYENGLDIRLYKRIPLGAGLGGGSSDAASTLLALNSMAETALSLKELREMASVLGSDVPFFLSGGAAYVSGRGELIEPVVLSGDLWVVLVKPPFSSNTADAYRRLDETRQKTPSPVIQAEDILKETIINALKGEPRSWPFYNDFLPVFLAGSEDEDGKKALYIGNILEDLSRAGAAFKGLSGSGSCCFGIFTAREKAEKAQKELSEHENMAKLTFFLAQRADPVLKY